MNNDPVPQTRGHNLKLYEKPWTALGVMLLTIILMLMLSSLLYFSGFHLSPDSSLAKFLQALTAHVLIVFLIVPLVFRLPFGESSYRKYLFNIGFTRTRPLGPMIFLGLTCYIILFLSQALGPLVLNLSLGGSIDLEFLAKVFDIRRDLPPNSLSLLVSFPSIFEEVIFRGIILSIFLARFGWKTAIYISALTFGLMHFFNLAGDKDLIWVAGQVVWTIILGTFYGYVFVKTRSLLPVMIVHYLGNVFVGSITSYLTANASIDAQAIYGVLFTYGLIPSLLMILWSRAYIRFFKLGVYIKNLEY